MNDHSQEQPNYEISSVCSEHGLQVFDDPKQILHNTSFDVRFVAPVFGKVLVFFGNGFPPNSKPNDIAYILDGTSPYRLSTVSECVEEGFKPVSITLDDADKFLNNPINTGVWLKGKSAKLTGKSENRYGDRIDFGDRKITSDFYLDNDSVIGKVFVPLDFDVLKDLQVSAEGVNPSGEVTQNE